MKCTKLLILLTFFGIVSCHHATSTINDVRETVFRYQFGQFADYYCIGVDRDTDSANELIKRFEANKPPVKKYSECGIHSGSLSERFRDKSGKIVIFYKVHSVKQTESGTVIVEASWDAAPLWGETHRYTMKHVNGKWIVIKDEVTVVS